MVVPGAAPGRPRGAAARFDAEATLAAIEAHQAHVVYLVPTMMKRIWRLPQCRALRPVVAAHVWHLAEPCPMWLKQAWIGWLGRSASSSSMAAPAQAATVITGVEWLKHRGSVGRPVSGEIMICDAGRPVPPGTDGEVWMRSDPRAPHLPLRRCRGAAP